jgi:hypothetical protein
MRNHAATAALGIILVAQPLSDASAAVHPKSVLLGLTPLIERVQTNGPFGTPPHGAPAWRGRPGPGPHVYPGWRGGPGWRGAAPWRGPPGWAGRPYWFGRPWGPRPYYGTIIAGVALGTLITVAAVGLVPVRPAPNLCWYWADPYGNQGYWDYCA